MSEIVRPFPDLVWPERALIGLTETPSLVGERVSRRTIHGRLITMAPPWGTAFAFKLTNNGNGVRLPPFDQMAVGSIHRYHSTIWREMVMPAGYMERIIPRPPVPGSLRARQHSLGAPVPVSWSQTDQGIVVKVERVLPWDDVHVEYRTAHTVMITSHGDLSAELTGRSQGWSLECEEERPS